MSFSTAPVAAVVDGGPIPAAAAAAAAIAPDGADGGGGGAAGAAVGGHLTLDNVRDGVVSGRTSRIYLGDIIVFLNWCSIHQVDWLTEHGSDRLHAIQVRRAGETNRAFNTRIRTELHAVLRDANQNPVIHLDRIQPERFIEFILTLRRAGTNRYLGKSSYGNKRASLFHLFRLHNRVGLTSAFSTELSNLFRGFYRQMVQQRASNRAANDEVAPPTDGFPQRREGKEPMSVELYKAICGWLLDFGTTDGVFAFCFLVLTWNLACRSQNTALIKLSDLSWGTSFDALTISFSHSKTDQVGEESKYKRHIYSNPHTPLSCPVFALSAYFSCCFNCPVGLHGFLFPGSDQEDRFGEILASILRQREADVRKLGFEPNTIGTDSIRKGAVSYLSSLSGGPPSAAICIRAGWTMGKIRDIHMRYVTSDDEFVGRCLTLLSVLSADFASSPPFFSCKAGSEDDIWVDGVRIAQFPMVSAVPGFGRLTRMCLASLLYHRNWITDTLTPNHVVRVASTALRSVTLTAKLLNSPDLLVVSYPWNDAEHSFSGIPPHVSVLQEMTRVRADQRELIDKVKEGLEQFGVNGAQLTEHRLRQVLEQFEERLRTIEFRGGQGKEAAVPERVETGAGYTLHMYGGGFHRIPADWRFPRCGVQDLWRQWWIGDTVRQVPPLRTLEHVDVKHLDNLPLADDEMHGRSGGYGARRRLSKKTLCDMRFLMNWMTERVEAAGHRENIITISAVDRMFLSIAHLFADGARDSQKRWTSIVHTVRRAVAVERANGIVV